MLQYLCTGQDWGKITRGGGLGGHGLDLPGTPWVCLHKGHKVGDTVEDVIWVKMQDPIILDDSGGHHDLHLADTSVHRVPRQLGLKNREQVAPSVQGRLPVPVLEPVANR